MFACVACLAGTVVLLIRFKDSIVRISPTLPGVEPSNIAEMMKEFLADDTVMAGEVPVRSENQICDPTTRVAELSTALWLDEGV